MIDAATLRWLVGGLCGAIVSLLLATWRTAQRSRDAEDALKDVADLKLALLGDQMTGRKGLLREVEEMKSVVAPTIHAVRLIYRAFRVPGEATDAEAIDAIRGSTGVADTGIHPVVQLPAQQPYPVTAQRRRAPALKPPMRREEDE